MRECDCGGIFGAKANSAKNPSGSYDTYSSEPIQGCGGYAPNYGSYEPLKTTQQEMYEKMLLSQKDSLATEAAPDTRANVEGFLLYIQGYQDALVVFSSMLEEVIGE